METTEPTRPPLGRMLVAKGLVAEDELLRALDEHERTGRPLGEILVSRGAISAAALTDALLLQDAWRPLGQLLVERGVITDEQLEQALSEQDETGRPLGEIVRTRFDVSAADLGGVIAEQHELELELERGFGSGLRRVIDARRRRRGGAAEAAGGDDAMLLTRLRPTAPTAAGIERIATLQAALEAREETIAALGSANRKRTLEADMLRRELAERDRTIDDLRRRLDDLEGGSLVEPTSRR
ncbi:MAG: hypothetical protein ICV64_02810 [Thermoleophilia bacterium]|nr:hypothetical protein [Thermoleophilia bacterium]